MELPVTQEIVFLAGKTRRAFSARRTISGAIFHLGGGKRMKKMAALFLALSMFFALTACGGHDKPAPAGESTGETTTITESTNNTANGTQGSTQNTTGSTAGGETTAATDPPATTPHVHSYSAATCTAPAKCSCGATKGSASGHNFNAATCTSPKTCRICGKTEGTAAGHSYDTAGTCTKCGAVLPEATEYISFNDIFLENYVKQSLGIQGTGKVSRYAMSQLTSLDIGENVTDVQDLKYATNLQSISINADNVKNLPVLCELSRITSVSFGFRKKTDLSFMKNMRHVERIDFNNAEIVGGDISCLISSPKLKELFYYDPNGSGIAFLRGANALERLELWHAFGENGDISVLKTLPELRTLEILTYNSASDAQRAVYAELIAKGVSVSFL